MATQNPIDQEGTYPLPKRNLTASSSNCSSATQCRRTPKVSTAPRVCSQLDKSSARVAVGSDDARAPGPRRFAREGLRRPPRPRRAKRRPPRPSPASIALRQQPRGAQTLCSAAGPRPGSRPLQRRFEDVQTAAHAALRHRLILNFEAEAEGITTDHIIAQILQDVPMNVEAVRV